MSYERIELENNTEIDWEGKGFYKAETQSSHASGEWVRLVKCDESESDEYFSDKPMVIQRAG